MNDKRKLTGLLRKIDTSSKVDDNGRELHNITVKIELLKDDGGQENIRAIAENLNKIIGVEFEAVQKRAVL